MSSFAILWRFLLVASLWLLATVILRLKSRRSRGEDRHRYARMAVLLEMVSLLVIISCFLVCLLACRSFNVSLVSVVSLCMLLLAMSFIRWRELQSEKYYRRLYEREPGFCSRCGYDLTGNTSGVCPECGWKLPGERKRGSPTG